MNYEGKLDGFAGETVQQIFEHHLIKYQYSTPDEPISHVIIFGRGTSLSERRYFADAMKKRALELSLTHYNGGDFNSPAKNAAAQSMAKIGFSYVINTCWLRSGKGRFLCDITRSLSRVTEMSESR